MKTRFILSFLAASLLLGGCVNRNVRKQAEWKIGGVRAGVYIEKQRYDAGIRYRARNTNDFDVCVKVTAGNIVGDATFFGHDTFRLVKAHGTRSMGKMFVKGKRARWYIRYRIRKAHGKCSY